MPTYLVNDNLQSYSPGLNQFPTGFQRGSIVFLSEFLSGSGNPSPTPAPGWYEKTGIYYVLFGTVSWPLDTSLLTSSESSTTVIWSAFGDGTVSFNPGTFQWNSTDPSNPAPSGQILLVEVVIESDGSASLVVQGATKVNTLQQVWWPKTWQIYQLNVVLGTTFGGFLTATCSLTINGVTYINNVTITSTLLVSSLWNSTASGNQWMWVGTPNGQLFGEFAITAASEALPTYPNPGSPIDMLMSQIVVEHALLPSNASARMSQLVIENMLLPGNRNMRASQMVVELIKKYKSSTGWQVYEA